MSFDEYKQKVDFIDFAQRQYGFRINTKKSTKHHVVLVGQEESERIILSRDREKGHYIYFNPHDSSDKGSVIDFVLRRVSSDWHKVQETLDAYLSGPHDSFSPIKLEPSPLHRGIPTFDLQPFNNKTYLLQRGLSEQTLSDPLFAGRIFNVPHTGKNGRQFFNTAFPCFNVKGEILGLEVKNVNYTGHALNSRKSEACWMSRLDLFPDTIEEFVLTEGTIDALSYHQLFPPQHSRLYLSSGGMLTKGQLTLIQSLIDQRSPKRLILGMDNDLAGRRYNLHLIGQLLRSGHTYHFTAKVFLEGQSQCRIELTFPSKASEMVRLAIEGMWKETKQWKAEPDHVRKKLVVRFPHNRESLDLVEDRLLRTRGLHSWIHVHRAKRKDFNEDLGN